MHAVIYISKAKPDFNLPQIQLMLERAKRFNRENDISGCIIYHKQAFIQLIEGQGYAIEALYDRIRADVRHERVTTLFNGPIAQRLFERWAMVFYELSGKNSALEYKRLMFEHFLESAHIDPSNERLLEIFRDSSSCLLQDSFRDLFDVVEAVYPATAT